MRHRRWLVCVPDQLYERPHRATAVAHMATSMASSGKLTLGARGSAMHGLRVGSRARVRVGAVAARRAAPAVVAAAKWYAPEDVKVGKLLGEGSFGIVYEGTLRMRDEDKPVILKRAKAKVQGSEEMADVERQLNERVRCRPPLCGPHQKRAIAKKRRGKGDVPCSVLKLDSSCRMTVCATPQLHSAPTCVLPLNDALGDLPCDWKRNACDGNATCMWQVAPPAPQRTTCVLP